jgi:hypothetical protein
VTNAVFGEANGAAVLVWCPLLTEGRDVLTFTEALLNDVIVS